MKFSATSLFTLVLVLGLLCPVVGSASGLEPVGDLIYVPAGETSSLPVTRLMMNDALPVHGQVTFRLLGRPAGMTAVPGDVNPSHLLFDPGNAFYGEFQFEYSLEAEGLPAMNVTGIISIIPPIQPFSGKWLRAFVGSGESAGPCPLGSEADIGWYDSERSQFTLCDYTGDVNLHDCRKWNVPGVKDSHFRLPYVGDWDEDGIEELALYDAENGILQTFDYPLICDREAPCELIGLGQIFFTERDTSIPLFGRWGSAAKTFATYDRVHQELRLPTGGPVVGFGTASGKAVPLVAGWDGTQLEYLGLWDVATEKLYYMVDYSGPSHQTFTPVSIDEAAPKGVPMAGRLSSCSDAGAYLGLFDPSTEYLSLRLLHPEPSRPALHVKVVVDPGTGGGDGD